MMKRPVVIFLSFVFFMFVFSLQAQNTPDVDKKSNFMDHVRIGGGIGLSFGDGFFGGTIAPSAIYDITEKFSTGLGLSATFNKQKNLYSSTIFGASILGLYNVIPEIQLSTEFEELSVSRNFDSSLGLANDTYWYPALFVGAGFRQNNFTIGIKYDVLYDSDTSVYADAILPFVRVYF